MKYEFKKFFHRLYEKFTEEDIFSSAAQVAFYFSFALFPLLLFLISLFGIILESADDFRAELFFYLRQVMPSSAYDLVQKTIEEVTKNSSSGKLTLGLLVALWSASAGIDSLRIALNSTYNLKETRSWFKTKAVSLFLTFSLTLLITVALGIVFYGWKFVSIILNLVNLSVTSPAVLITIQIATMLVVLMAIFGLLYSFLPNHQPRKWVWITPGAIVSILLWVGLSYAFRVYLSYFNNYDKTYGSLGAVIILMLWLFLTALVILFGGMINSILQELTDPEAAVEAAEAKQHKFDPAKSAAQAEKAVQVSAEKNEDSEKSDIDKDEAKENEKTRNKDDSFVKEKDKKTVTSPPQIVKTSTIQSAPETIVRKNTSGGIKIGLTVAGVFGFLMGIMFRKNKSGN